MTVEILALNEITDSSAGGKAYGLARLVDMGLPVPPAFVIRNATIDVPVAPLLQHYSGLNAEAVAVRSSALGEDGDDASFAGQYETVLNVRGERQLLDAIRQKHLGDLALHAGLTALLAFTFQVESVAGELHGDGARTRTQRAFEEEGIQFAPRRVLVEATTPEQAVKAAAGVLDQEGEADKSKPPPL